MCRPTVQGRPAGVPGQAIVEFAQQLLTSHPGEAARAFAPLVVLLEQLLADAAAAGEVRPGLDHRRIAGVVLQATMFNTFSTTISGSAASPDGDVESGALWICCSSGSARRMIETVVPSDRLGDAMVMQEPAA